jgi:hypothetical protein
MELNPEENPLKQKPQSLSTLVVLTALNNQYPWISLAVSPVKLKLNQIIWNFSYRRFLIECLL